MSDISDVVSNERLEELAKGDMEVWYSESQSMARELLALRKERERAAPVAWRHDDGPFASGALTRSKSVAESWIGNGWKVTPLYTAPPAPVVPEEIDRSRATYDMIDHDESFRWDAASGYVHGWNACRAAMLDQK